MEYTVKLRDDRKKVPRNKLLLHFFAGESIRTNNLFMVYDTINQDNPARHMLGYIETAFEKLVFSSQTKPELV